MKSVAIGAGRRKSAARRQLEDHTWPHRLWRSSANALASATPDTR